MAKKYVRKIRKGSQYRIDIRCLTFEEYKMLCALVVAASDKFSDNGVNTHPVGTFDLCYIRTDVFTDRSCFRSLANLLKIFK